MAPKSERGCRPQIWPHSAAQWSDFHLIYRAVATARHTGVLADDASRTASFSAAAHSLGTRNPESDGSSLTRARPCAPKGGVTPSSLTSVCLSCCRFLLSSSSRDGGAVRGRLRVSGVGFCLSQEKHCPTLGEFDQICAIPGKFGPIPTEFGPSSAKFRFDKFWPNEIWLDCGQILPPTRPTLADCDQT